ncbi:MAG: hypothetical protein ABJG88_07470, partial [Litorimonas sp.]
PSSRLALYLPLSYLQLMPIARLDRTIFRLSGDSAATWLEGLTTNTLSVPISFNALLTPQGKIIADFFVTHDGDDLLLDTPEKFAPALFKRLRMYRLRAPIDITQTDLNIYAIWEGEGEEGYADPRHSSLGRRLITADYLDADGDYNAHRLSLGVVDSAYDFETITTFPADANMDLMAGVDFKKGCFVGQEVVSRMKRMTTVKKRMRGIVLSADARIGDKIKTDERIIGDVLHIHNNLGIAMIRLDRLAAAQVSPSLNSKPLTIMRSVSGNDA